MPVWHVTHRTSFAHRCNRERKRLCPVKQTRGARSFTFFVLVGENSHTFRGVAAGQLVEGARLGRELELGVAIGDEAVVREVAARREAAGEVRTRHRVQVEQHRHLGPEDGVRVTGLGDGVGC